jgi:mRNA-degrading endonuclease toxin of MazEF toxin-antitoxin module
MEFEFEKMYYAAIKRGDIILADLNGKKTAVLILQDNVLNERISTVLAAIIKPLRKGEHVFKNEVSLSKRETGLGKAGVCLLHQLQPVDRTKLTAKKGEVGATKLQEIYKVLDLNLGRYRDKKIISLA